MSADDAASSIARNDVPLAECALARAVRSIGDAWTLLILREALCGVQRFDAIRQDLAIPRSVLADRLARLVADGILEQRPYRDPGQRSRRAYVLTDAGRALVPALIAMRHWAERHLPGGRSPVRLHGRDGQEVFVRLVRADGSSVEDPADIVAICEDPPSAGPNRSS